MKYLKDYPKIYKLLTSSNKDDVLIGAEFLKELKLPDTELLYMLPSNQVGNLDRDIPSGTLGESVVIQISENIELHVTNSWVFCQKIKDC